MVKIKPLLNSLLILGFFFVFATKELLTTANESLPRGGVYTSLSSAQQYALNLNGKLPPRPNANLPSPSLPSVKSLSLDADLENYLLTNPTLLANSNLMTRAIERAIAIQNFRRQSSRQALILTPPMTDARFDSGASPQRPVTAAGRMPQMETIAAPRPPLTGPQTVLRAPEQPAPEEQEAKRRAAYRPASSASLPPLAPLSSARNSAWPSALTALPVTSSTAALRAFQPLVGGAGQPTAQPQVHSPVTSSSQQQAVSRGSFRPSSNHRSR